MNACKSELLGWALSYFVRNPEAADSLEGVARWRLLDEVIRRKLDETEAALIWLAAQGFLMSSAASRGTRTFRINPTRIADARRFIAAAGAPKGAP